MDQTSHNMDSVVNADQPRNLETFDSLVIDSKGNYSRTNNEANIKLRDALQNAYTSSNTSIQSVLVTSSGMNAIFLLIQALAKRYKEIDVIYPEEIYCDTPKTFEYIEGVTPISFPVGDYEEMKRLVNYPGYKQTVLFVESCSNPNSVPFDFQLMGFLKAQNVITIVDNTWLTHLMCNPFEYGVDFVILSLTKYYSGGSAICGAILSGGQTEYFQNTGWMTLMDEIFQYIKRSGIHISPYHCQLVVDGLLTMKYRLTYSSELTEKVIDYISTYYSNKVVKICLTPRYNGLIGSVFTVYIPLVGVSRSAITKKCKNNPHIEFKTSYGSKLSRFDPFNGKDQQSNCVIIRIAIGYEDTFENITKGLDMFFDF